MRLTASGALLALAATSVSAQPHKTDYNNYDYYVLEHDPSSSTSHHEVASTLGTEVVGQVGELRNHWLVSLPKDPRRAEDSVMDTYKSLRKRAKSAATESPHSKREIHQARRLVSSIRSLERQIPRQRTKRWLYDESLHARQQEEQKNETRLEHVMKALNIADPEFHTQWHLLNEKTPTHDMNVTGVWEMGYTGKGVIAAIVDDGLDYESEDLADNYVGDLLPSPIPQADTVVSLVGSRLLGL